MMAYHELAVSISREYKSWSMMKGRCLNKKAHNYNKYGGRGIKICDRWLKFENFFSDMGTRPHGTTLERKNNNGNYEPSNCCWADIKTQNLNRSIVRRITFRGKTQCLTHWANEIGIDPHTLRDRLDSGLSIESALTTPKQQGIRMTNAVRAFDKERGE